MSIRIAHLFVALIMVSFVPGPAHTATLDASIEGSGSISGDGIACPGDCTEDYDNGTEVTILAVPDPGWQFYGWSGSIEGTLNPAIITMNGHKTIIATFLPFITATSGSGGSISPSGDVFVAYGSDQTFTITPNTGFHVADVYVDGAPAGAVSSYTFTNVTAGHTISASFASNTYTITSSAGIGGSVAPLGSTTVAYGGNQTFIITPNTGFHVADVLVDGASVGAVSSYAFTNVTASHTISASFAAINTYTITSSAGVGGSVAPLGSTTLAYGSNQTFIITPNTGYHVADVYVDGAPAGAVSSYTFTNVSASHTISASFATNAYTINATTGSGGSISPSGVVGVSYGGNQTFTITPNTGYHVADVYVDGASAGTVTSYTFTNVTTGHTISASFVPATGKYTLNVNITGDGTVTMDPEGGTFDSGTLVHLIASPLAGWVFSGWNGDLTGFLNPVTITMDGDKTIEALFLEEEDHDGTLNTEEQGPDGSDIFYDGNNDGIQDWTQANVVSRHTYDGNYYLTIVSPPGTELVNVTMTAPPQRAPADYKFPYGLIRFEVSGIAPGGSTTVNIILPQPCTEYFKYDETNDSWDNFFYHSGDHTGASINRNIVTLYFVDGLRGDQDGVANGIISDPGTPAIKKDDSLYQHCFITTADTHQRIHSYLWVIILLFNLFVIRSGLLFPKRRTQKIVHVSMKGTDPVPGR